MLRWSANSLLSGTLGTNSTSPSSLPVGSTLPAGMGRSAMYRLCNDVDAKASCEMAHIACKRLTPRLALVVERVTPVWRQPQVQILALQQAVHQGQHLQASENKEKAMQRKVWRSAWSRLRVRHWQVSVIRASSAHLKDELVLPQVIALLVDHHAPKRERVGLADGKSRATAGWQRRRLRRS